jgi:formylglycine-generating enzyme required for sulfatase activity
MAHWKNWLRCLAQAVWQEAPLAIAGLVPLGERIVGVAARLRDLLRQEQTADENRAALAELVTADPGAIQAEALAIAQGVAADQSPQVQHNLAHYLELAPLVTRQSLSRPEDPPGLTVPPRLALGQPHNLLPFIPPVPPRFRPGEAPPCLNGWVLVRRLGAGGFGEVWQVRHPDEERLVAAVKFCLDDSARRLLAHEAKVIGRLMTLGRSAPGIVPLLDFNVKADPPWLKYEFVDGGDLRAHAALFFGAAGVDAVRELAEIVGQFHQLDPPVVHRDLKPSNILLTHQADGRPGLRIADFGISGIAASRALDQEQLPTQASAALPTALIGSHTPLYASPQQRQGAPADPRDDVFALGVLWYQLLAGNLNSERPSGKWRKKLARLGLSEQLLDLLESCCDDDPDERPRDAGTLAQEIGRSLAVPAEAVRPPPAPLSSSSTAPARPRACTKTLQMSFMLVPAGTFWMGGGGGKAGAQQYAVGRDFYLGVHPVTQGQWMDLMGDNPSWFSRTGQGKAHVKGVSDADLRQFPVESVSWEDAREFLERLNAREKDPDWVYCLTTEAEWEYACRGGATSREDCSFHFYLGRPSNALSSAQANFDGKYPDGRAAKGPYLERTSKVGSYPPNALGVCDLHGNVWEWCEDSFDGGPARVLRGGSWDLPGSRCRAAYRYRSAPSTRSSAIGFRVARVPSGR